MLLLASVLPDTIWSSLLVTLLYGLAGIFLVAVAVKVFDWVCFPKLDLGSELSQKNVAVAVVVAAFVLGAFYMIHGVIR